MSQRDAFYVFVRVLRHEPDTGTWATMSEKCHKFKTKRRAYKLYEDLEMPRTRNEPQGKRSQKA
jgi:hypothetical protein